jgi:hypothetical protein
MTNQRKEVRKKIMAFTPVYNLDANVLLGYIGDLTLKGALLVGEKHVENKDQVTLAIDFPPTAEFPARRLIVSARIAWCRPQEEGNFFDTGVEFQGLSKQNEAILSAILERYQYRHRYPN